MGRMASQYIEICIKNVTIKNGIEGLPPDLFFIKSISCFIKKSLESENVHNSLQMEKKQGKKTKNAEKKKV